MERQKDTFEERYASKMTKILTKISKETDKARLQAASTKTSPFQVTILREQHFMFLTGIAGILQKSAWARDRWVLPVHCYLLYTIQPATFR